MLWQLIHTCKPCHVTQSPIDRHWMKQIMGIVNDMQHLVRHSCAIVSFDTVLLTNLNQTKASFYRMSIPINCHPLDGSPYPKSIYYLLSIFSIILVSLNHRCEHSFASVNELISN